jgi:hypothetical protein
MKKNSILLILLMLLFMMLGVVGCSSDDDSQNSPNSVNELFDSAFASSALLDGIYKDTCCLINSRIELQRLYHGAASLPSIDFEKISLVIGHIYAPYSGCNIEKKEMSVTNGVLNVHVTYSPPDAGSPGAAALPAFSNLYFWGLCPKANTLGIFSTKMIYY